MIDLIIPTYRRTAILRRVLPYYLAQQYVSSIIIVEDGPLSPEVAALAQEEMKPRIITIATGRQSGAPAAKRLGLEQAKADFAAFGEDDAFPAPDYYARLLAHVREGRVDVASGAVHYLCAIDEDWREGSVARVVDRPTFDIAHEENGLMFGAATLSVYLGRLALLLQQPPDDGYRGNGWREETDPLIALWGKGRRIALDSSAVFYHLPKDYQQGGGQHARSRFAYEYWCLRNDAYFFRKHGESLKKLGFYGPAFLFALKQAIARWRGKISSRLMPAVPSSAVTLPRPEMVG
ncbi:MAG: glycosyltransferase [Zoogloea oleivorans]|jgi:glycosyltransferase involved in cell wall biosynthesis|uniref:glycosyltransferase family 2 protein n=1 Tax=Zoogloea oleivorans TaxID=1552750 RepID=UPI002A35EED5|nr:glycosyltransferase [Zoogloea oleivorans]MDY0038221.1 glycosyltransferase [Zoogloea oleivorans]